MSIYVGRLITASVPNYPPTKPAAVMLRRKREVLHSRHRGNVKAYIKEKQNDFPLSAPLIALE